MTQPVVVALVCSTLVFIHFASQHVRLSRHWRTGLPSKDVTVKTTRNSINLTIPRFYSVLSLKYNLEAYSRKKQVQWVRGGRPTTTNLSPSHILLIFSSEPPRNPRSFKNIFLSAQSIKIRIFFENLSMLGNK